VETSAAKEKGRGPRNGEGFEESGGREKRGGGEKEECMENGGGSGGDICSSSESDMGAKVKRGFAETEEDEEAEISSNEEGAIR